MSWNRSLFILLALLQISLATYGADDSISPKGAGDVEVNIDGKKVKIPYDKSKNKKFSPEQMEQLFAEGEGQSFKERMAEGLNELKTPHRFLYREVLKPAGVLIKEFPTHAIPFYAGMGALTWAQALINDGHDPMAMENFFKHLNDAPALIGFWAFMYGNNRATAMMSFLSGRSFEAISGHLFYSQIGMSAGSILSGFTSEFLNDPNVQTCAKEYSKMSQSKSCAEAYSKWTSSEKWWDFAPGVVKVVASGLAAGASQMVVGTGVTLAIERGYLSWGSGVASKVGLGLKYLPLPVVKFGQTVTFGALSAAHFLAWDSYLSYRMHRGFFDVVEAPLYVSPSIQELTRVTKSIEKQKYSEEALKAETTLDEKLANYDKNIKRYRSQKIMYESEAEYSAWMNFMGQYLKMREFSFQFYHDFIENSNYANQNPEAKDNPLFWEYPLKGVEPKLSPNEAEVMKFEAEIKEITNQDPSQAEHLRFQFKQQTTVKAAADLLEKALEETKKSYLPVNAMIPYLLGNKISFQDIEGLIKALKSSNLKEVSEGIRKFQTLKVFIEKNSSLGASALVNAMNEIEKLWGYPMPSPYSEEGYAFHLGYVISEKQQYPFDASFKMLPGNNLLAPKSNLIARSHAEWNLIAMVCGPDIAKGEITTSQRAKGFQIQFVPPKIVDGDTTEVCNQGWGALNQWYQYIFTENSVLGITPITSIGKTPNYVSMLFSQEFKFKNKTYKNLAELIRDNIKPEILGNNKKVTTFGKTWWKENVSKADKQTLMDLQDKYEQIIKKSLLPQLNEAGYSGPTAKGLGNSLADEAKIFSDLLVGIFSRYSNAEEAKEFGATNANVIQSLRLFFQALTGEGLSLFNDKFYRANAYLYSIATSNPGAKNINLSIPTYVLGKQLEAEYTDLDKLDWNALNGSTLGNRIKASLDKIKKFNSSLKQGSEFIPPSADKFRPLYNSHLNLLLLAYDHLKKSDSYNKEWRDAFTFTENRLSGDLKLSIFSDLTVKIKDKARSLEVYDLSIKRLIGAYHEAYLNHQIIFNLYNSTISLTDEKLKINERKTKGGRLGM